MLYVGISAYLLCGSKMAEYTFWPPASQLYSPASALPACCTTSRRPWPVASTRTFELELSFLPSLYSELTEAT